MKQLRKEILKNLQTADSLSPPPSPLPKELKTKTWFSVACYGQFALPMCKELKRNPLGNWVILIFSGQKSCTRII